MIPLKLIKQVLENNPELKDIITTQDVIFDTLQDEEVINFISLKIKENIQSKKAV